MIVGDGMLASAYELAGAKNWDQIIFASGVSNSLEKDPGEFQKEIDLLLMYAELDKTLVYFSTVSIFDHSLASNPYIRHKIKIEKVIEHRFNKYLIIRLPIVVGKSANPHTLTNFLFQSIITGNPFRLFQHATRYLIDLDDVVRFTRILISKSGSRSKVNLVLNNKMHVPEILELLSALTGKRGNYELIPEGSDYEIDNSAAIQLIGKDELTVDAKKYNFSVLKKYYGN
jgi:nucleoside-diphosphate-sugar epimerase